MFAVPECRWEPKESRTGGFAPYLAPDPNVRASKSTSRSLLLLLLRSRLSGQDPNFANQSYDYKAYIAKRKNGACPARVFTQKDYLSLRLSRAETIRSSLHGSAHVEEISNERTLSCC